MITYVTSANGRFGKELPKDATTATLKGQVLIWDVTASEVVPADATTTFDETMYLSTEVITAGEAKTLVHTLKLEGDDQFIADTVNNSSAAHNGQRMILDATGSIVNNTGTDSAVGVVRQVGVKGAPADKQIIVEFVTR